ncbi:hypothetical protein NKH18_33180 [Streptomyces sp. M10(2022)]
MGLLSDARIVPAPEPRHGHLSTVRHSGEGLFAGIPQNFTAVRYHSLSIAEPVPDGIEITARAEDGVVMGLAHRERPWWACSSTRVDLHGVRRPPRGQLPRPGPGSGRPPGRRRPLRPGAGPGGRRAAVPSPAARPSRLRAEYDVLDRAVDAEAAYLALYAADTRSFWLDSSHVEPGRARFSFFGAAEAPEAEMLTYRVEDQHVVVDPAEGASSLESGTIFDALDRRTGRVVDGADALPFDFTGGYVGYFGYELKADLGARRAHPSKTPDAVWLQADRFVAVDHAENRTYVVAVCEQRNSDAAQKWIRTVLPVLAGLPPPGRTPFPPPAGPDDASAWLSRPREQYLEDIRECDRRLREGVSYEICLTNQLRLPAPRTTSPTTGACAA